MGVERIDRVAKTEYANGTEMLQMADTREDHPKKPRQDKLTRLIAAIRELMELQFTGYIKINFTQGALGRVEKFEEILRK
ncbi:MAG: hypothetical protein GX443_08020 [Deltaproteobacteria bacterium]|nr:hypothetical protein [Deltaproteobacteria bacterium]